MLNVVATSRRVKPAARSVPVESQLLPGQGALQAFLILIAVVSVPMLLLPKPLLLKRQHERRQLNQLDEDDDAPHSAGHGHGHGDHFEFGEVCAPPSQPRGLDPTPQPLESTATAETATLSLARCARTKPSACGPTPPPSAATATAISLSLGSLIPPSVPKPHPSLCAKVRRPVCVDPSRGQPLSVCVWRSGALRVWWSSALGVWWSSAVCVCVVSQVSGPLCACVSGGQARRLEPPPCASALCVGQGPPCVSKPSGCAPGHWHALTSKARHQGPLLSL